MNKEHRIFASLPRTGSTMCMALFSTLFPEAVVTARTILMTRRYETLFRHPTFFEPDYSIYDGKNVLRPHPIYNVIPDNTKLIISKEEFGNNPSIGSPYLNECNYPLFRDDCDVTLAKPAFLFRHPLAIYRSWLRLGWQRPDALITAYVSLAHNYQKALSVLPNTHSVIYESLTASRAHCYRVLSGLFMYWELDTNHIFEKLDQSLMLRLTFWSDKERVIYEKDPYSLFSTLHEFPAIRFGTRDNLVINDPDARRVMKVCMPLYEMAANDAAR